MDFKLIKSFSISLFCCFLLILLVLLKFGFNSEIIIIYKDYLSLNLEENIANMMKVNPKGLA